MGLFGYWHKGDALIDQLIVPPVYRFEKADEAVAQKAKRRRDTATTIRQRALAVEAGAAVSKVLTMANPRLRKER